MSRTSALWAAGAGVYGTVLVLTLVRDSNMWLWVVYVGALAVGFVSNRWIAAAIALAVVPAAMIGVALDGDEPVGDAGSGVVETGLLTLVFVVVPAAIVVCLGVLLRRGLSRIRRSASAA